MTDLSQINNNYAYWESADFFEPPEEERIGGSGRDNPQTLRTGAIVQPNGDVLFRLYAPEAKNVTVSFGGSRVRGSRAYSIDLEKKDSGVFEGVLPYRDNEIGARDYTFIVDGARLTHPLSPTYFRTNKMTNCVQIPDKDFDLDQIKKGVPQGAVVYRVYWSSTYREWKRCVVYLPAEYYSSPKKFYPVLWLNNGGSEDETTWTFAGKAHHIMDNLIYEGKAVPMIVVQCNTMARLPEEKGTQKLYGWRDNILNDCMPFIHREYRCLEDKWNRAMCGNSMGSMATGFMGFAHPELFGSLGFIAGSVRCHDWLETYDDNEQIQWMVNNAKGVNEEYRVLYFSLGEGELRSNPYSIEDLFWLEKQGIVKQECFHYRFFSPDFCHDWSTFRRGLAEFVTLLFREDHGRYNDR